MSGESVIFGGIGYGSVDIDLDGPLSLLNNSDGGIAYQVGAGVTWNINEQSTFELGYRYKGISGVDVSTNFMGAALVQDFGTVASHNIIAGISFKLP